MSSALISIRTDEKTKKQITEFAASLGLSTSAFATSVMLQAVRDRHVSLTPSLEPTPYLEKIMREAEADRRAGRNVRKFKSNKEAIAHLRSL